MFLGLKLLASAFLVNPYLQLGNRPSSSQAGVDVVFQSLNARPFRVELNTGDGIWRSAGELKREEVFVKGENSHYVYTASLDEIRNGRTFSYRVWNGSELAFESKGKARPAAGSGYSMVLWGDSGSGLPPQVKVAKRVMADQPDGVVITGDLVYDRGRVSEYQKKWFPVYNALPGEATGSPLMASILFMPAPGNHDLLYNDADTYGDLFAYFRYWRVPLNGPVTDASDASAPKLKGSVANITRALSGIPADRYPRAANYSFDFGNSHWTILDSNPYVDWKNPRLQAWVEADLAKAKGMAWRFVAFHHPPFHSSPEHQSDQQMRALHDIFRKHGVKIVFCGHVHNYQRSKPVLSAGAEVSVDNSYDGSKTTQTDGVIYVVTGGGGARLYSPELENQPEKWKPWTAKYSGKFSYTRLKVSADRADVECVSAEDGAVLDRWSVRK
jgi:3',5'-cyclic AMP phosphodiesterase CpdA